MKMEKTSGGLMVRTAPESRTVLSQILDRMSDTLPQIRNLLMGKEAVQGLLS